MACAYLGPEGVGGESELAHWDCWGWSGMKAVSRPEPNTTLGRTMELLLDKVRLVDGEQDWSTWEWGVREDGTREPRTIRFRYEGRAFVPVAAK